MLKQIQKSLGFVLRQRGTRGAFWFSTKMPEQHEVSLKAWNELFDAIDGSHSCNMIGQLLKSNLDILSDKHLWFSIH